MADADELDRRARELLAAYRTHAGPSPARARRLLADVHRGAAAEGLALAGPATPPRRRLDARQWRGVALVGLIAAAVIAAIRLAPERLAARTDRAAGAAAEHDAATVAPDPVKRGAPAGAAVLEDAPRPAPGDSSPDSAVDPPAAPSHTPAARGARRHRDTDPQPASLAPQLTTDPPPGDDALAPELAFLREVNHDLAAGAPERALTRLAGYDARFPGGRLREEAGALRAVATCAAGLPRAREGAAEFLRAHPASLSAERVRRACDFGR